MLNMLWAAAFGFVVAAGTTGANTAEVSLQGPNSGLRLDAGEATEVLVTTAYLQSLMDKVDKCTQDIAGIQANWTQKFPDTHCKLENIEQATTQTTRSFVNADGTFIQVSISPRYASSSFLVQTDFVFGCDNPNGAFEIHRQVGTAAWEIVTPNGFYELDEAPSRATARTDAYNGHGMVVDTPGTLTQVSYRLFWRHLVKNGGTMYQNRAFNHVTSTVGTSATSTVISVLEIPTESNGGPSIAYSKDTTGKSFTDADGTMMEVAIAPKDASSSVFITSAFSFGCDNPNGRFTLQRSIAGGAWTAITPGGYWFLDDPQTTIRGDTYPNAISFIDTPNTASQVSYRVQWLHEGRNGGTMKLGDSILGTQVSNTGILTSTMMAMELPATSTCGAAQGFNDNTPNVYTDADGTFTQVKITTRKAGSKVLVGSAFSYGANNPNGHWTIERSTDGSSWSELTANGFALVDDPLSPVRSDMYLLTGHFVDTTAAPGDYFYRVQWKHIIRNGGNMYASRPEHTTTAMSTPIYAIEVGGA